MSEVNEVHVPPSCFRRRSRLAAVIGACALCAGIGYVVGRVHEDFAAANRRRDDEIARIREFLDRDPGRYDGLTFDLGPWGRYLLEGDVRTPADLRGLTDEVTRLVGEWRAAEILNVEVSPGGASPVAAPIR